MIFLIALITGYLGSVKAFACAAVVVKESQEELDIRCVVDCDLTVAVNVRQSLLAHLSELL